MESLKGVQIARNTPPISHLLFADDSLLLFKASSAGVESIRDTITQYCNASGQRVNRDKSSIFFGKGCPQALREDVKAILQVSNESINKRYLGLPSDVGRSKNGSFKYLRDQ